ncbi:hypothetical protein C6P96_08555 [Burkholderia multivorans]|uniref:hypothetical protein n=1 Tax=Burkholderia multivorans TaxID=87883 RepID=UPI000D010309|nr:hypothetical protein [Burkholderia multivorans]PRE65500.1 hypothetical protein C6P95_14475 [Burkholderia multivorans]PRF15257.1 hypothetical protein C6P96_08555 [Burkholderia multivorans]
MTLDTEFKLMVAALGLGAVLFAARKIQQNGGVVNAAVSGFNAADTAVTGSVLGAVNSVFGTDVQSVDPVQWGYQAGVATRQFIANLPDMTWQSMQGYADARLQNDLTGQPSTMPFQQSAWDGVPMGL